MDLGKQIGRENRAKRHQKWYRKNDKKMKDSKMTKKSKKEAATILDPRDPGPGEVPPFKAGQSSGAAASPRQASKVL